MSFTKKVFFATFLMVLSFGSLSYSQSFALQQFTTENGLPGSTAYSIIQDKNKVLWIATDGGICKYNGHSFEVIKDENIKSEVVRFFLDSDNKVWMVDLAKKISVWNNDTLFNFYNNTIPIDAVYEDFNKNLWFTHRSSVSIISKGKELREDTDHLKFDREDLLGLKVVVPIDSQETIVFARFNLNRFKNYENNTIDYVGNIHDKLFPRGGIKFQETVLLYSQNRIYSFSLSDNSIEETYSEWNHLFDFGINSIFLDQEKNLWVASRNGVLFFQKQKDNSIKLHHLLKGISTSNVFQDHENNFWVTTQREGVFKLSSIRIQIFEDDTFGNRIATIDAFSENEIITSYHNNWIAILNRDLEVIFKEKLSLSQEEIYDSDFDKKNNALFIAANFGIFKLLKNPYRIEKIVNGSGLKTVEINNYEGGDDFWYGDFNSARIVEDYDRDFKKNKKRDVFLDKRTYSIENGKNGELWVGTVEGLFDCKSLPCKNISLPKVEIDIRDIALASDGTLWIATQSDGIYVLKNKKPVNHFTSQNGLSGDHAHEILLKKNTAWIATNNGVSKINLEDNSIEIIRKDNGLPSNDVRSLHMEGDKLYLGTNEGLAVLDKDFEIYDTPPNLFISNIQIENQDTAILSNYDLSNRQNDLRIKFAAVTFKSAKDVIYQYKMSGVNEDWIETKLNEVTFPSLNHGDYNFEVKAKALNSDWTTPLKVNFKIKKAWWQTYWFYLLITGASLFIILKIFQSFVRGIKRRNQIEQNLTESQLTALRAQMDPHFIFNAMNSIQDFIIQDDKRTANHYLAQFSKLMRNILNASDKNKISLQKEIDYLKLYLSLEALRFEDSFSYEFEMDEHLDAENITIPSLLIQPFVENAIKHGLMHKKGEKKLWVRFFKKEDALLCEVEDNGIGREKSKIINQQNQRIYKSKGIGLTKERIDLLNSVDPKTLGLKIEDLKNPDGSSKGTKVIIRIQG